MVPQKTKINLTYYENKAKRRGYSCVIGIDEAGRGPLAGPVVAAAVRLRKKGFQSRIADSKKLSPWQREKAFQEICQKTDVGVGIISPKVIDQKNILEATYDAMSKAVRKLVQRFPQKGQDGFAKDVCLLIDGRSFKSKLPYSYETIIKGDSLSLSIACASIIAKVTRDKIMEDYDKTYPVYGFKQHKGYPTRLHKQAIQAFGLSKIHRKTFKHD